MVKERRSKKTEEKESDKKTQEKNVGEGKKQFHYIHWVDRGLINTRKRNTRPLLRKNNNNNNNKKKNKGNRMKRIKYNEIKEGKSKNTTY